MIGRAVQKVRSWMRQVLPGHWAVLVCAIAWPLILAGNVSLMILSGSDVTALWNWIGISVLLLSSLALLFGLYRLRRFHPIHSNEYREWLKTVPWRPGKPLPLGPVHYLPQDAVIVGLLTLPLLWQPTPLPLWLLVPVVFLAAGVLHSLFTLFLCREWLTFYALCILCPLPILLLPHVGLALGMIVLLALFSQIGLMRSLRTFPWENEKPDWWETISEKSNSSSITVEELGWPFIVRNPKPPRGRLPVMHAVLISLIAGWYQFLLIWQATHYGPDKPEGFLYLMPGFIVFAAGLRVTCYTAYCRAPLNIWGRLATGNWIIPGYDKIFVAPLLAALAAVLLPFIFWSMGFSAAFNLSLTLTLCALLLTTLGPRISHWELTGLHRRSPKKKLPASGYTTS